ncbi:unnamed protein product [Ceratitis capitata]|uniref:(Mediterranean fruit fly) hypothetical protein n=1 Tax=Ceratitis capitata TaxID=7213 RepID=A0A811V255_CERCA|nr:unnamed protein product [Ceratitis capitata]
MKSADDNNTTKLPFAQIETPLDSEIAKVFTATFSHQRAAHYGNICGRGSGGGSSSSSGNKRHHNNWHVETLIAKDTSFNTYTLPDISNK